MNNSPLRYPGGKNRLANFMAQICKDNNTTYHYIEPYCGGAAVALHLLLEQKVDKITLNDKDRSIYAFWYCVLYETPWLRAKIRGTEITIEEFKKQKAVQKNKEKASLQELGFSTLFLNRTCRSGILNAGVIGGNAQKGKYKINDRFNKEAIIEKINLIGSYSTDITLYNVDGVELLKRIVDFKDTLIYLDPPYYIKGTCLYPKACNLYDHKSLAKQLKNIKKAGWVLSYDNETDIHHLYDWVKNKHEYTLTHYCGKLKQGKEVIFFSDNLKHKPAIEEI